MTIVYWVSLIYPSGILLSKSRFSGIIFTNFLIFILLATRWLDYGYFPLSNLYESLLFLAWSITFITVAIESKTRTSIIGSLSTPISLFLIGFAGFMLPESMQTPSPLVPALKSNWLMMHVTVMMLSYASLLIGSLLSMLFLIITNKKMLVLQRSAGGKAFKNTPLIASAFYQIAESKDSQYLISYEDTNFRSVIETRLNFLDSVDNLSYQSIGFGFPLLTLGIIAGAVWANEAWGSYWNWDPKETWSLITWLVFASYLHARITKSWHGRKPAFIASVGFITIWICYLGVNFLGKGLHTYGQFL
jgi:cytochrome c-type biogenesis protein CcsB